jgi:hypothetical protein
MEHRTLNDMNEMDFKEAHGGTSTEGPDRNEAEPEAQAVGPDDVLGPDEMWVRVGNNKKWRDPGKDKQRKKMAKASKKRNRR